MKLSFASGSIKNLKTDVIAVAFTQGQLAKNKLFTTVDGLTGGKLKRILSDQHFEAKSGQVVELSGVRGVQAEVVLVVGLGDAKEQSREALNAVRLAASRAAQRSHGYKSVSVVLPWQDDTHIRAAAEGLLTGAYRYTTYLTGDRAKKHKLTQASLWLDGKASPTARNALSAGEAVGQAINLVRDLVNAPPNDQPPRVLADVAAKAAKSAGIDVRVFDKKRIEKEGMNLFLAVNRGSVEEPRLVHMVYKPKNAAPNTPRVMFVGKGLTFDSGGLCIKPAQGMGDMKCDMAGSAVTLGILLAVARLRLPVEVHGVMACTENMPDGAAYRPGDVYTSMNGKTVEIINTDAEGRLVLADAFTYALRQKPDVMIDHATLTGACMVALGPSTAGLFSNNTTLGKRYLEAARSVDESVWPLPLTDHLKDELKSDIADMKHTGERLGGAITAALFLEAFVENTPWIHMDIAGPAFADKPKTLHPKGGTGFGVLTAIAFLESLANDPLKL